MCVRKYTTRKMPCVRIAGERCTVHVRTSWPLYISVASSGRLTSDNIS